MRRWLRGLKELQLSILTMGSSVLIAACYGAQYAGDQVMSLVSGMVRAQGTGVADIEVCVDSPDGDRFCAITDINGHYDLVADDILHSDAYDNGCTLEVRDVDGPVNGEYAPVDVDIAPQTVPTVVDVDLEPAVN